MKRKVLIVDEMHPSLLSMLTEIGFYPDYQPKISREQVLAVIAEYEGIIVRSKLKIDSGFLEKATQLCFIARAGAGLDQINIEETSKCNITLLNAPEGNRDAVGEHCIGMLLCLFNKIHLADRQVKEWVWDREGNRGIELMGKTVGILGYGNMGKAFAQRLAGFRCRILANDIDESTINDEFVIKASLAQIQAEADIFSLHIPLTAQNKQMFTPDFFAHFQKDIFLLNTARGELIDLELIKQNIQSKKFKGACLDVLENEKLATMTVPQKEAFTYLQNCDNVIFTPHVAGWTEESYVRINEVLVEKIKKIYASKINCS
jgi:D-3-phosphoglycerate dehydrogenase